MTLSTCSSKQKHEAHVCQSARSIEKLLEVFPIKCGICNKCNCLNYFTEYLEWPGSHSTQSREFRSNVKMTYHHSPKIMFTLLTSPFSNRVFMIHIYFICLTTSLVFSLHGVESKIQAEWVALLIHFPKVRGSNFGRSILIFFFSFYRLILGIARISVGTVSFHVLSR